MDRTASRQPALSLLFASGLACLLGCQKETTINSSVINGAAGQGGAAAGGGTAAMAGSAGNPASGGAGKVESQGGSTSGNGGNSGEAGATAGGGSTAGGTGGGSGKAGENAGGASGGVGVGGGETGGAAPDVDCRAPGATPRLLSPDAQEITAADDFSKKAMLASAQGGSGYLLAWMATDVAKAQVAVQAVDAAGKPNGPRRVIADSAPHDDTVRPVRVVWDGDRGKFVVGWIELEKALRLQVVSPAGEPEGNVIEVGKESNLPLGFSLAASEGDILVPHDDSSNAATFPYVTATGAVQKVGFGCYCATTKWLDFQPKAGGFFSLLVVNDPAAPGRFFPFQPSKADEPLSWVTAVYPSQMPHRISAASRLVSGDGSKYLVASPTPDGVTLDTFAPSGTWIEAKPLLTKTVETLPSVVRVPAFGAGGAESVLVLGKQGAQYLVGGSSLDGAAVTTTKAVLGGAAVSGGAMHWGGDALRVFWMDKPSSYERIYSAPLRCQ